MTSKQAKLSELVLGALQPVPRPMREVYEIVLRLRPGTAKETIRARVYEAVAEGRVLKVATGVYVAIDGPASLLLVTGDAWSAMPELPNESVDLLITDAPFDLGTQKNALQAGTSRGPKGKGRSYPQRDLDEAFLRHAHRVLVKKRPYPGLRGGTKEAGGFCVLLTPLRNKDTNPHINRLIALAESVGFEYEFEQPIDFEDRSMGYWPPQQHWLWLYLCATPRAGIPRSLKHASVLRVKRVKRKCVPGATEHEAEKPVEAFMAPIEMLTSPGDVVLDPFAGRARWAKHAVESGRHVVLIEQDPAWVERIIQEDLGAGA